MVPIINKKKPNWRKLNYESLMYYDRIIVYTAYECILYLKNIQTMLTFHCLINIFYHKDYYNVSLWLQVILLIRNHFNALIWNSCQILKNLVFFCMKTYTKKCKMCIRKLHCISYINIYNKMKNPICGICPGAKKHKMPWNFLSDGLKKHLFFLFIISPFFWASTQVVQW